MWGALRDHLQVTAKAILCGNTIPHHEPDLTLPLVGRAREGVAAAASRTWLGRT
jgi:hypothetical protein